MPSAQPSGTIVGAPTARAPAHPPRSSCCPSRKAGRQRERVRTVHRVDFNCSTAFKSQGAGPACALTSCPSLLSLLPPHAVLSSFACPPSPPPHPLSPLSSFALPPSQPYQS
eukprot:870611-Rhodomonas_salina.4